MLNPVRCGATRFPGEYDWSSDRATAGLCAPSPGLATDEVLAEYRAVCHLVQCGAKLEAGDPGYVERITWIRRQLESAARDDRKV